MNEKKYQVFISSTQQDLAEERRRVIEAVLSGQYIPIAMEQFPAHINTWSLITNFLEQCDYYVLILGGKYGSINAETGISYTEMEYDYAREKKIPILAFTHQNREALQVDNDEGKVEKLSKFYEKVMSENTIRHWKEGGDLVGGVLTSLNYYTREIPRAGWIRGDSVPANLSASLSNILRPCEALGIVKISTDGKSENAIHPLGNELKNAKEIRIISTSAFRIFEDYQSQVTKAIANGAILRVLVPERSSQFLQDVEESERRPSGDKIADEIARVEDRLLSCVRQAQEEQVGSKRIRGAYLGHFSTHLRSTIILCDSRIDNNKWGWLTVTLPPLRAVQTASFEMRDIGDEPLIISCHKHFERVWEIAESRNQIKELK